MIFSLRIGRVAQAFDLAGTTSGGCPILRALCEGWELECSDNGTNTCRIDSIASRPCKERKDGAPTVVLSERKPRPKVGPPAYPSAWLHPCRARFRFPWPSHCSSSWAKMGNL
jgi:hypothetical protein